MGQYIIKTFTTMAEKNPGNTKYGNRFYISKEELEERYVKEDMTIREIAALYGCGRQTICNYLVKYNIDKVVNKEKAKQRSRETCLRKYGITNGGWTPESQEKIKQTNLERYGEENYFMTEEFKEKSRKTCLEQYGVEYTGQIPESRIKSRETTMQRYGVEHASQAPEVKERVRETNRKKFGYDYASQNPEIKQKIIQTCLERWGSESWFASEERARRAKAENWPRGRGGASFNRQSSYEFEIIDFIKTFYQGEIIHGTRQIISPYELDIYIPEKQFAIEFNGDYWHSDEVIQEKYGMLAEEYHTTKEQLCADQNIRLMFVWEHEWLEDPEAIKEQIKNKLM